MFFMGQGYPGEESSWMELSDGAEWGISEEQDCVGGRESLRSRATLRCPLTRICGWGTM